MDTPAHYADVSCILDGNNRNEDMKRVGLSEGCKGCEDGKRNGKERRKKGKEGRMRRKDGWEGRVERK